MEALVVSINSIIPIILLIILGYYLQAKEWFKESFGSSISRFIMNVALPASIFVSVLKYLTINKLIELSSGLLYTLSAVAISYLIAYLGVFLLKIPVGRRGTFINTFANANTIFIGLPLNIALFGDKSLPYFLVYYITNTISTWAIGVFIMSADSPNKSQKKKKFNWKKLFPAPLLGFLVALVFLVLQIPVPSFATATLGYLGGTVTPLSLIYIGLVLQKAGLKSIQFDRDTIGALTGRFIIAPLAMLLVITMAGHFASPLPTIEYQTFMIQSATPVLAVLPILANEAGADVRYATNVVTTSTILFAIVVPIISLLLGI